MKIKTWRNFKQFLIGVEFGELIRTEYKNTIYVYLGFFEVWFYYNKR